MTKVYEEFYLSKVGNDYDQWMLIGVDENRSQGDTIATFTSLYYAELVTELLNNMLSEEVLIG